MALLLNATPHQINLVDADGKTIRTIEPSGVVARCTATQTEVGQIEGIPIVKSVFSEVTGLPEPDGETVYIVSSLVAQALAGKREVVSPDTGPTALRTPDGKIAGVRRFQKF
ncbi:MAG: hypothetical protein ACOZBZ_04910 [Patescibacteria group bacterium]